MGPMRPAATVLLGTWLVWLLCVPAANAQVCSVYVAATQQSFGMQYQSGPVVASSTTNGLTKTTRRYCFQLTNDALRGPTSLPCSITAPNVCCNKALVKIANIYIKTRECGGLMAWICMFGSSSPPSAPALQRCRMPLSLSLTPPAAAPPPSLSTLQGTTAPPTQS
jgi:hypothetical protein